MNLSYFILKFPQKIVGGIVCDGISIQEADMAPRWHANLGWPRMMGGVCLEPHIYIVQPAVQIHARGTCGVPHEHC